MVVAIDDDIATGTLDSLDLAFAILEAFVDGIDPDTLTGDQAALALEKFLKIERAAAAGRLGCAQRAAQCMRWREDGHPSAGAWLAQKAKTSVGEAISMLETAEKLPDLPATAEALRRGAISPQQVREIAAAAAVVPAAERELLEAAEYLSLKGLQYRARSVRATAEGDEAQRQAAVHKGRYFRHWSDPEGGFNLRARLTPENGALILSAVRSHATFVYDEQLRSGSKPERQEALDADALVALVTGDERRATFDGIIETRRRAAPTIFFHVNVESLRRGNVDDGELCEIVGIGPVPLATLDGLLGSAWAKLVIRDGADVLTACSLGRVIPAPLDTALSARDQVCVVPGCDVYTGLEIDHIVPFSQGGPTAIWNLARLCRFHHRQKTYEGYELRGGPGSWEWTRPDKEPPEVTESGWP